SRYPDRFRTLLPTTCAGNPQVIPSLRLSILSVSDAERTPPQLVNSKSSLSTLVLGKLHHPGYSSLLSCRWPKTIRSPTLNSNAKAYLVFSISLNTYGSRLDELLGLTHPPLVFKTTKSFPLFDRCLGKLFFIKNRFS